MQNVMAQNVIIFWVVRVSRDIKLKAEVYTKGSGLDLFRFNLVLMFTSILKRAFDLIWATINLKMCLLATSLLPFMWQEMQLSVDI